MRDGLIFRSLPFFTGSLAFLPACNGGSSSDSGGTTGDTGGTTESSVTQTTLDESTSATTNVDTSEGGTTAVTITTGEGSSSESGDPECGPASTCGDEAPVGWFGPVIHARFPEGSEPPACPEAYSDPGPTLLAGFNDPGPAICGCECELSMMQNCYTSLYTGGVQPTCSDWGEILDVTETCITTEVNGFIRFNASGGGGGLCDETEMELIPPLVWESAIRTCRLDAEFPCGDGGVCTPDPAEGFEDIWCIYQQGDLDCPAGPFSEKQVFYTAAEDTRDCTNCQCGSAGISCSDLEVGVYAGTDCAGEPVSTIAADGVCTAAVGGSVAGNFGESALCPVTEPSLPEGALTAMGPFTFCCQPG